MKKLFKIMIALVLMLTFTFTITACNDEGKDVDPTTLTVADVFQEVEIRNILEDKTEKLSYSEVEDKYFSANRGSLRFKCYASYKFEVSKIVIKSQELSDDYTHGNYSLFMIYYKDNSPVVEKKYNYTSENDFNIEHTTEFAFSSGELVIEKNKVIELDCSGSGATKFSIQILGSVIAE